MATAPPILIWTPGGGTPVGGVSSGGPVYSQAGTTPLVNGQSYVDVVFGSVQTNDEWVLVECIIVNEIDVAPLNIWPGIITDKTAAGFRLQLNGLPDSSNYYLHWAVSGVNIPPPAPFPATTYTLTGPSSGAISVASTDFTVRLPLGGTVAGSVIVTPDDGGGGTFTPATVALTTGSPSATFTYTPASYGAKTISVTNDGGLADPGSLTYTVLASTYTLSGPSSGAVSVASTNFTVALPVGGAVTGTITITPGDGGGGGTFTPTTVNLTTGAPSATFTYTPGSLGTKTISVTNNGGLTNPGNLSYTVAPGDGDPVSSWVDSSGGGHTATQTGSARPTLKTNIVNSKPVVRFTAASSQMLTLASTISSTSPWTVFVVMKPTGAGIVLASLNESNSFPCGPLENSDSEVYVSNTSYYSHVANTWSAAFHVFSGISSSDLGGPTLLVDGTNQTVASAGGAFPGNFNQIGSTTSNGDIAELIVYNVAVGSTDRANIEKYLGTKYGITVAGGTAVDPSTVTGLVGWWKADSI